MLKSIITVALGGLAHPRCSRGRIPWSSINDLDVFWTKPIYSILPARVRINRHTIAKTAIHNCIQLIAVKVILLVSFCFYYDIPAICYSEGFLKLFNCGHLFDSSMTKSTIAANESTGNVCSSNQKSVIVVGDNLPKLASRLLREAFFHAKDTLLYKTSPILVNPPPDTNLFRCLRRPPSRSRSTGRPA